MNDKLLLAGKLYQLADICKEIGHLLEKLHHEIPLQEPHPLVISNTDETIIDSPEWPLALTNHFKPEFSDVFADLVHQSSTVLECIYHQPLNLELKRDLLSIKHHEGDHFVRYVTMPGKKYDLIILNHYLEFLEHPLEFLQICKQHLTAQGKIYCLIKPWVSSDGGYQSSYYSKAFIHLCAKLEHNNEVKFKITRPVATILELAQQAELKIIVRNHHNMPIPEYISKNRSIMDRIIANTWGTIRTHEALSIMHNNIIEVVFAS
jgi:hypothetical protein